MSHLVTKDVKGPQAKKAAVAAGQTIPDPVRLANLAVFFEGEGLDVTATKQAIAANDIQGAAATLADLVNAYVFTADPAAAPTQTRPMPVRMNSEEISRQVKKKEGSDQAADYRKIAAQLTTRPPWDGPSAA